MLGLGAGNHRLDQILAVHSTGDYNSTDVNKDQQQSEVCEKIVHFVNRVIFPILFVDITLIVLLISADKLKRGYGKRTFAFLGVNMFLSGLHSYGTL